ncbi:hypothetical protein [Dactylosporangium sp. NPDC049140]|uniref:hypothetical protein n=1 Tax=Dactylosporangium sp. NPDC049140 TaxID=3155647 RepID=UPI0033CA9EBC
MTSPDRLELTPQVWRAARTAVGRGAPSLALGTSSRALSVAAERLSHLTADELGRPGPGMLARLLGAVGDEGFHFRRLLARAGAGVGLLVALALFSFGSGSGAPWVVMLGAALAIASVGAAMLTLRMPAGRRAPWDMPGVAVVAEVSEPPGDRPEGSAEMELVVDAPGLQQARFRVEEVVAVDRWPEPGATLPVRITGRRVTVDWDRVVAPAPDDEA